MGVPTIATDCPVGGSRMVIENNINGILVPVGDIEALCTAMERIAKDPKFATSLLKEKMPLSIIADKWLQII